MKTFQERTAEIRPSYGRYLMANSPEPLAKEVSDLLLLSKTMMDKIRVQIAGTPDRHSVAFHVLIAHDAAELALRAISIQIKALPKKKSPALMDYVESINAHDEEMQMPGAFYFDQLNRARNNLKHGGVFPDTLQLAHVGAMVYDYVSECCLQYLGRALDEIDESTLLHDRDAKILYHEAKQHFVDGEYRQVMEKLALALYRVFESNLAVRNLSVGIADVAAALRLASFGVQANDFLTLQNFLPRVIDSSENPPAILWQQNRFGHPGNWNERAASFCLRIFLDTAAKIQSAPWIPGPIYFNVLYDQKLEALKGNVEIWNLPEYEPTRYVPQRGNISRTVVKILPKNTSLNGWVSLAKKATLGFETPPPTTPGREQLVIVCEFPGDPERLIGYVASEDVRVTCTPKKHELVQKYYPELTEIDWQPSEE